MGYLEGREEEFARRQLQESDPLRCYRGFQEHNQIFGETEACENGDARSNGSHHNPFTQLIQVIPNGHAEVVGKLLLVREQELLYCRLFAAVKRR